MSLFKAYLFEVDFKEKTYCIQQRSGKIDVSFVSIQNISHCQGLDMRFYGNLFGEIGKRNFSVAVSGRLRHNSFDF